jgi:WD40 repeat protein
MVEGQSDCVYGIGTYPRENVWGKPEYSRIYASGCEDGYLYIWDSHARECLHALPIRRFDDHKPEEEDPELRAKDAGFPRNELLKVRAVEWSTNGDQLVLTTCGVVGADEDDDDYGGVIQIYAVDERWFMDDDQFRASREAYESDTFLLDYRVWEAKDCNMMIDDCKFSPDGRFLAAGCHDSNIYLYEVQPKYVGLPLEAQKPKTFALKLAQEIRQRVKKIEDAVNASTGASLSDGSPAPPVARDTWSDKVRKTPLFAPFLQKTIILPRQARDKHRENSKNSGVFLRS